MASIFAGASAAADAKVSQMLASAGPALSGAVWAHDNQHIKYCLFLPKVLASSVVVPGRATLADLARFSAAMACDVCLSGSAERQCAACQDLLCAQCAVRCALDHDSRRAHGGRARTEHTLAVLRAPICAFAMCVECDSAAREGGVEQLSCRDVLEDLCDLEPGPRLYDKVCKLCREEGRELRCPAHADLGYLACEECGRGACYRHCPGDHATMTRDWVPSIMFCGTCNWIVCGRNSCSGVGGRHMLWCEECTMYICSTCQVDRRCDECNASLVHLFGDGPDPDSD